MDEQHGALSIGATGGLPGANAVSRASEVTSEELDDTVAAGGVDTTPVDPALGLDADDLADLAADRDMDEQRTDR